MGALLCDLALLQHDDLIGFGNRAQAVGDGDHRAPLPRAGQRVLDLLLGVGIQRRCRLVQQQDRRVLQQGARDAHTLFLASGQFQPTLSHLGVIAFGQTQDEIVDLGILSGLLDLFLRGPVAPIGDVVADRVVEQHRILRHHADGRMQAFLGHIAHILTVNAQRTAGDIVEAEQQPPNRGFARPG